MASFAEPHQHPCVHNTSCRVQILAHNAEKRKTCLEGGWEMGFFKFSCWFSPASLTTNENQRLPLKELKPPCSRILAAVFSPAALGRFHRPAFIPSLPAHIEGESKHQDTTFLRCQKTSVSTKTVRFLGLPQEAAAKPSSGNPQLVGILL